MIFPLVSAVITTCNRPIEILERAIISVKEQTYNNLEIIIVNDAPENKILSNEIKKIAYKYDANFFEMKKNSGACAARNYALNMAKGTYIAYLDDDDEWCKDKVEVQVNFLQKNKKYIAVYCNSYLKYENKKKVMLKNNKFMPDGNIFKNLLGENFIGSCTFPMFLLSALKKVNGFNEKMPALQDWELYLRVSKNGLVGYIDEPLAIYHVYVGERISAHSDKRVKAYKLLEQEFKDDLECNKICRAKNMIMGSYFYSMNGDIKKAISYLTNSFILYPHSFGKYLFNFIKILIRPIVPKRIA